MWSDSTVLSLYYIVWIWGQLATENEFCKSTIEIFLLMTAELTVRVVPGKKKDSKEEKVLSII